MLIFVKDWQSEPIFCFRNEQDQQRFRLPGRANAMCRTLMIFWHRMAMSRISGVTGTWWLGYVTAGQAGTARDLEAGRHTWWLCSLSMVSDQCNTGWLSRMSDISTECEALLVSCAWRQRFATSVALDCHLMINGHWNSERRSASSVLILVGLSFVINYFS